MKSWGVNYGTSTKPDTNIKIKEHILQFVCINVQILRLFSFKDEINSKNKKSIWSIRNKKIFLLQQTCISFQYKIILARITKDTESLTRLNRFTKIEYLVLCLFWLGLCTNHIRWSLFLSFFKFKLCFIKFTWMHSKNIKYIWYIPLFYGHILKL